jgi:prevent-host-death family protein
MIYNVSEAKTQLSKLIDLAYQGESVIIAKHNLPLVELVAHKPQGKRQLGRLVGKLPLPKDLLSEDPEIDEMFYGGED